MLGFYLVMALSGDEQLDGNGNCFHSEVGPTHHIFCICRNNIPLTVEMRNHSSFPRAGRGPLAYEIRQPIIELRYI